MIFFFLRDCFSLTTKYVLKCRLKFNPRPETHFRHLRHTWDSACTVKSRAEVFLFFPDFPSHVLGCKLVWVTYWHLKCRLRRLDLKDLFCCLTIGFFLACWSVSLFVFFSCYPSAWVQNDEGMLLLICCIYIKHVRCSQEMSEVIKELSLISPKAECWKDAFTANTVTKETNQIWKNNSWIENFCIFTWFLLSTLMLLTGIWNHLKFSLALSLIAFLKNFLAFPFLPHLVFDHGNSQFYTDKESLLSTLTQQIFCLPVRV